MKAKELIVLILMFTITFSNALFAQETEKKGNFRFGMISAKDTRTTIQPIDNHECIISGRGIGLNCEVYLPIKNIKNVSLLVGAIWIDTDKDFEKEINGFDVTTQVSSDLIGGYIGLRSSVGKVFGMEGSASIGYFAHRGGISFKDGDNPTIYSLAAGSSFGGILSIGPFIQYNFFNLSANVYYVGAGGETGVYTSSGGFRLLLGTAFNI